MSLLKGGVLQSRVGRPPATPHGGVRPFHQKTTCLAQLTLGERTRMIHRVASVPHAALGPLGFEGAQHRQTLRPSSSRGPQQSPASFRIAVKDLDWYTSVKTRIQAVVKA